VLEPADVPADADLVVVGNPTNPTSVLHPAATLRALARPGRLLVVDEAFADCIAGEQESLAAQGDLPGLMVVRSLTKTWGLAGLRAGYLLAAPELISRLAAAQPQWAVSAPALVACAACSSAAAVAEATAWAGELAARRACLLDGLTAIAGVHPVAAAQASFVLIRTPVPELWNPMRDKGFAVRRGDTFPGLGPDWIRVAVRDDDTTAAFVAALEAVL
jgi:histidinol-phosphate aminotransferase